MATNPQIAFNPQGKTVVVAAAISTQTSDSGIVVTATYNI